jgi:hypothetical protein
VHSESGRSGTSSPRILPASCGNQEGHTHLTTGLRSRDLEQIRLKMRKRIITEPLQTPPPEQGWPDLESIVSVEVTSECNSFPSESALLQRDKEGWRAAEQGSQTIQLIFRQPQRLRDRKETHAGIHPAMVARSGKILPGNRAAAVEFQFAGRHARDRGLRC